MLSVHWLQSSHEMDTAEFESANGSCKIALHTPTGCILNVKDMSSQARMVGLDEVVVQITIKRKSPLMPEIRPEKPNIPADVLTYIGGELASNFRCSEESIEACPEVPGMLVLGLDRFTGRGAEYVALGHADRSSGRLGSEADNMQIEYWMEIQTGDIVPIIQGCHTFYRRFDPSKPLIQMKGLLQEGQRLLNGSNNQPVSLHRSINELKQIDKSLHLKIVERKSVGSSSSGSQRPKFDLGRTIDKNFKKAIDINKGPNATSVFVFRIIVV